MIQYVLLNIIQVDILQTEKWLSQLFEISPFDVDNSQLDDFRPLSVYFKENGYEVRYVLGNLGSSLIYLAVIIAYLLSYGAFRVLGIFS